MTRGSRVEPRAERDLIEHAAYLGERSEQANSAVQTFFALAETPGLGAIREFRKASLAGVRAWRVNGFPKYLIFYRVTPDGVSILRVLHAARDLEAIFADDDAEPERPDA